MIDSGALAVFIGSATSVNVGHVLHDVDSMVPGDHHLIATSSNLGAATDYSVFGTSASDTLRGQFQALSQYLNSHTPRLLLQITDPPVHGTIAGILAYRHDVPFIYRYSGDRFYEYRVANGRERLSAFALGAVLGRIPIRLANRHIALGPTGKRRLIARGVAPERITILPPAVDPSRFTDSGSIPLDVPDDRKIVLYVGRLSQLKGAETLGRVIPTVLDHRDDVQFVCVGPVEEDLDIPESAREHVTLVGRVPPEDIAAYMAAANLLVHPSLSEGLPRVLLESLAAGTPVFARDVGDVASITDNTFESDEELAAELISLESIPLDDVTPFTPEQLGSVYRDFFDQW